MNILLHLELCVHNVLNLPLQHVPFPFCHLVLWRLFQMRISECLSNGQWLFTLRRAVQFQHMWICTGFVHLNMFQWWCAMVFYTWVFCAATFDLRMIISESAISNNLESEVTDVITEILHLNINFMGRRNGVRALKD